MENFRDALDSYGLRDLGFSGLPWTYDNKKPGRRNVKVRLDRGVADQEWMSRFGDASVTHLTSPCSDHCPILLQVLKEDVTRWSSKQPYYEIMLKRDPAFEDCVKEKEATSGDLGVIHNAVKRVLTSLKKWSSVHFGSVRKELDRLRERLAEVQADGSNEDDIKQAIRDMNKMLYREEMLWLQRLRVSWSREGDQNTKFFHQSAVCRTREIVLGNSRRTTVSGVLISEVWKVWQMIVSRIYIRDQDVQPHEVVNLF